jgi:hypothetical protein
MIGKKIKLGDIVKDIKSGMDDVAVMEKHELCAADYVNVLKRLRKAQTVPESELDNRLSEWRTKEGERDNLRETPRCYLVVTVRISDAKDHNVQGQLLDLSEKGCRLAGIPCTVGETRKLRIEVEVSEGQFLVCKFTAQCRWQKKDDADGSCLCGFEITHILPDDAQNLQQISKLLAICDSY